MPPYPGPVSLNLGTATPDAVRAKPRYMEKTFTAVAEVLIQASPARVWEVLVSPVWISRYFFGTRVETDWQEGHPIRFHGAWEGKAYEDKGTILVFRPEECLSFTYWSSLSGTPDVPENYAQVTESLHAGDGGTRLQVTQDNCPTEESRDQSVKNWMSVLETIKKLIEEH